MLCNNAATSVSNNTYLRNLVRLLQNVLTVLCFFKGHLLFICYYPNTICDCLNNFSFLIMSMCSLLFCDLQHWIFFYKLSYFIFHESKNTILLWTSKQICTKICWWTIIQTLIRPFQLPVKNVLKIKELIQNVMFNSCNNRLPLPYGPIWTFGPLIRFWQANYKLLKGFLYLY